MQKDMPLHQKILNDLRAKAADVLHIDMDSISAEVEIPELGFDSTSLTEYVHTLSRQYDIDVHPGVFFEYTTLSEFVTYLLEEHHAKMTLAVDAMEPSRSTDDNMPERKGMDSAAGSPLPDHPTPVIIGAGITGMCISRALSQQGIAHVMIGNLVLDSTPKLGESMNESASIDFLQDYSEFNQFYFIKNDLTFYSKEFVGLTNFLGQKGHAFYDAYERLGFNPGTPYVSLIHVDRIGFDRQLYEQVTASPHCTLIPDTQVSSLEYDKERESIERISLSDGSALKPSFVFDATNHVCLLARLLEIEAEVFDKPRRVFFTHYYSHSDQEGVCPFSSEDSTDKWMHSTTIIRTSREADDIDGVSWCIPEGRYISVGISMDLEEAENYDKETALNLLVRAYRRRGIDYLSHFPDSREIVMIPKTSHFIHRKIHGDNWLMAGGSASQIWYPSGSNISLSLFAAKIAPKVLMGDPEEWLRIYHQINQNLVGLHQNWTKWVNGECRSVAETGSFAKEIYSIGNKRMALYALVRNGEKYAKVAREMSMTDIPKYALMSQEIRVIKETDLSRQTEAIGRTKDAMYAYIDRTVQKNNMKKTVSVEAIRDGINKEIATEVSQLLGVDERSEFFDLEITELGFSSMTLTNFAENISNKYDITIHPGVFFEYTTLNAFVDYLLEEHIESLRNYFKSNDNTMNLLAGAHPATMNKSIIANKTISANKTVAGNTVEVS